jgi:hypothetical protein
MLSRKFNFLNWMMNESMANWGLVGRMRRMEMKFEIQFGEKSSAKQQREVK